MDDDNDFEIIQKPEDIEKINISDEENQDGEPVNMYKAISNRVNRLLNDKNYVSTDDMTTTIIFQAGNCYHENISPKNFNVKRN